MKKQVLFFVLLFASIAAQGREGIYLEFKITTSNMSGTNKTYWSAGDSRTEMTITNDAMPKPFSTISLMLHASPDKIFSLNEQNKTYTETDISKSPDQKGPADDEEYEVTVIGKESVNGYNSTHVNVTYKHARQSTEMWLSKDVKGYADYTNVKSKYLGGSRLFSALKEKGADGFVVRMTAEAGRGGKMQMDLVTAEKRNITDNYFSLDGYTRTEGATMPGGIERPDIEKIKKMTPEERKKYIDEMKARYTQPH